MLAGYLPFDDDPANPEGDNINLLYKYIVSTPLTFPEYVTPHARDLLRRILVPDPRRRADLFEVARHSWLSEYSHVVGFIGSNSKDEQDIAASAVSQDLEPTLGRSASVREPQNRAPSSSAGTSKQQPTMETVEEQRKGQRDAKRRTIQVEYVAPNGAHARGESSPISPQQANVPIAGTGRTRARPEAQGPVEVVPTTTTTTQRPVVPRKEVGSQAMPPPSRSGQSRAASDSTAFAPQSSSGRPVTRGTLASRGNSYSQPAVATSTAETAQGHFSRPKSGSGYIISGSMPPPTGSAQTPIESINDSEQSVSQMQSTQQLPQSKERGHKRSSTLGSITDRMLGRSNSRRQSQSAQESGAPAEKRDRRHPPVSMKNAMGNYDENSMNNGRRPSTDSRRSSFQFLRKDKEQPTESRRNSRRFSFLPNNFSMNSFGGGKREQTDEDRRESRGGGRPSSKGMAFGRGASRSPTRSTNSSVPQYHDAETQKAMNRRSGVPQDKSLPHLPPPVPRKQQYRDDGYGGSQQDPVERYYTPNQDLGPPSSASDVQPHFPTSRSPYPTSSQQAQQQPFRNDGYGQGSSIGDDLEPQLSNNIRPNQRKFGDAYDKGHEGSSSGARRVMDFFRRRGRERGGD
jgi:protein-serine/threonine kinase